MHAAADAVDVYVRRYAPVEVDNSTPQLRLRAALPRLR